MKTHKNIDRLFQEKLKDFEVSPPKDAWNNIEKVIHGSDRKPLIPLWFKIGSAAAILLLLTITGVNYFNTPTNLNEVDSIATDPEKTTIPTTINPSEENPEINDLISTSDETLIVDTNIQENENVKNSIPVISKELNTNKSNDINQISSTTSEIKLDKKVDIGSKLKSPKNTSKIAETTSGNAIEKVEVVAKKLNADKSNNNNQISSKTSEFKLDKKEGFVDLENNTIEKNSAISSNKTGNGSELKSKTATSIAVVKEEINKESETLEQTIKKETVEEKSTEDVITEITNDNSINEIEDLLKDGEKDEGTSNKWSVATQFGPVFYNSFTANNSLIDESFIANENQISNSVSAGIKVAYKLNKKLSLQSGINIINVTSQTNNVFVQTSLNPEYLGAISYAPLAQLMNISAAPTSDVFLARSEVASSHTFEGALNQEFGYIEVPLEVKYSLTNGKVGLNLVGGFSTLFLNKNSIQYETVGFTAKIGEANNLNDVNFSGNLGLDVDYKINKQIFFNLSPMVKIQTNTFSSNSGNFKPYVIGVYTGLNYRF